MCWSDARLLTSIMMLPSRCVFPSCRVCCFHVLLCLWCSWRNIGVILLDVRAQLGVPASTMNIGHVLFTRLLVKQTPSTVCPLMTDQVIKLMFSFELGRSEPVNLSRLHCPPFLICKHLDEGGGYLLLLADPPIKYGTSGCTDTPVTVSTDMKEKF